MICSLFQCLCYREHIKVQTGNGSKKRYTNKPEKLSLLGRFPVLFYVAIRFVLKLLRSLWMLWESSWNIYNEFSIFSCLASIPWDDIKRQPFLTPMSEFQQAAIKETENFAKTPKEKSCQQIFNRGLRLSTASLTGCKCSKANVVVASSACWYQMFQQAIRLAIHFARRCLLVLAPNPMERRSSFCGCAFLRNAFLFPHKWKARQRPTQNRAFGVFLLFALERVLKPSK